MIAKKVATNSKNGYKNVHHNSNVIPRKSFRLNNIFRYQYAIIDLNFRLISQWKGKNEYFKSPKEQIYTKVFSFPGHLVSLIRLYGIYFCWTEKWRFLFKQSIFPDGVSIMANSNSLLFLIHSLVTTERKIIDGNASFRSQ